MPNRHAGLSGILKLALLLAAGAVAVTVFCYVYISFASRKYMYTAAGAVPEFNVGLVLGTARYLPGGGRNPYFDYRIDAAVELYRLGRIRYIIASGDNSMISYNEPAKMREALISRGIPAGAIYLDFAGFRTLDSVVRGNKVFGQDRFLVISQKFHAERAVYISRAFGIDAFGFSAVDVEGVAGIKTHLREYLARVAAVIDVVVLRREPKFLGDRIPVGD